MALKILETGPGLFKTITTWTKCAALVPETQKEGKGLPSLDFHFSSHSGKGFYWFLHFSKKGKIASPYSSPLLFLPQSDFKKFLLPFPSFLPHGSHSELSNQPTNLWYYYATLPPSSSLKVITFHPSLLRCTVLCTPTNLFPIGNPLVRNLSCSPLLFSSRFCLLPYALPAFVIAQKFKMFLLYCILLFIVPLCMAATIQ